MFTAEERQIFAYPDGRGGERWADPLEVHCALIETLGGDIERVRQDARAADPVTRAQAQRRLAAAVREAFGLPRVDPITGAGATMRECLDALEAFLGWLAAKKAQPGTWPTSSAPSLEPVPGAPSIMPPSLASG